MAYAINTYTGDGTTDTLSVTFPYISTPDVVVTIDGVTKTLTTDYTFATSSTIQFTSPPAGSTTIKFTRSSNRTARLVDYQDGSTITLSITLQLENVDQESVGWQIVVPDSSLITISGTGWSQSSISGNVQQYLNEQEIANAVVYESGPGTAVVDIDRVNTATTRSITLTFISKSTGAYKHFNLTMPKYPLNQ